MECPFARRRLFIYMESENRHSRSLDKCGDGANNNNMTNLCPFCNAALPALAAAPTADRLACPRCGEAVPASRWLVDTAIASVPPKIVPPSNQVNVAGNRRIALILVSVMVTMAIIGLSYALWTTKLRRLRDPRPLLDPITIRRPMELQGLGFVPKDSQVIIGLHLSEWLDDKDVGKPLIAEPRPAFLDFVVVQLPRITGMKLEEIDHVVLAVSFDPMRVVMIVRTRRPYDLEKIVKTIGHNESEQHLGHPLYHFSLNPVGNSLLWCVEDKTLICVIPLGDPKLDHLQSVSAEAKTIEETVSAPLRQAMKERLPGRQFLWAVGRLDQMGPMKALLPVLLAGKADLGPIRDIKTFAAGLAPVEGLTMTGHFQVADAKAAAKLVNRLEAVKIDGAKSQKVETSPDERDPWITWQVRGDVAVMRRLLNQGQDAKK
jgi:hypothetical protein